MLAIQENFRPQKVIYNGGVEWSNSCYMDMAMRMKPATEPDPRLREICAPLLLECDRLFADWYRLHHGEGSISALTRLQSFVTRYRPQAGENQLARHVDGRHGGASPRTSCMLCKRPRPPPFPPPTALRPGRSRVPPPAGPPARTHRARARAQERARLAHPGPPDRRPVRGRRGHGLGRPPQDARVRLRDPAGRRVRDGPAGLAPGPRPHLPPSPRARARARASAPTLALALETSRDGALWHKTVPLAVDDAGRLPSNAIGSFDAVAVAGWQRRAFLDLDRYVRVVWTIIGSGASFTFALSGSALLVYARLRDAASLAMRAGALGNLSVEEVADQLVAASDQADQKLGARFDLPLAAWGMGVAKHTGSIFALNAMGARGYAPEPGARDTWKDGYDRAMDFFDEVFTRGDPSIKDQTPSPADDFQVGGINPPQREWTSRGWAR